MRKGAQRILVYDISLSQSTMLTLLSVSAGGLTFGQFIKKPCVAYRPGASRVPVSETLRTEHVEGPYNRLPAAAT